MEKTSIGISKETHELIKAYCNRNSLKVWLWVDKVLRKEIELRTIKK